MTDWLKNLKVGDEVVLNDPYAAAHHRIERVTYVNRFVVRVARMSFARANGTLFVQPRIEEPTPERLAELRDSDLRFVENARLLLAGKIESLTLDQLRRIVQILDEAKGETK